jgi:hypothetical protein
MLQGSDDGGGGPKVHVRNPQGNDISIPVFIPFQAGRSASFHRGIKIKYLIFSCGHI